MKMMFAGSCNECGAWAEALATGRRCPPCHKARFDRLEDLAEIAGMYRERLPAEVAEALEKLDQLRPEYCK